ncbi:MAG: hypothetical protein ABSE73_18965 [Planctomycetota bacterium]
MPKPPSEEPGETLRPAKPVELSNETASLLPGGTIPSRAATVSTDGAALM